MTLRGWLAWVVAGLLIAALTLVGFQIGMVVL